MLEQGVWERLERFSSQAAGRLIADLPLCAGRGGWPDGAGDHRMDAVWLPEVASRGDESLVQRLEQVGTIDDLVSGQVCTLVVARGYIDRTLLGLLAAGRDMFSRSFPDHGPLRMIGITDQSPGEANIEWVWAHHGLEVVVLDD